MAKVEDNSTEEKILEAAKEAFMKHGLYGARMQDIADNAGINKALLHYYFRSKEQLFDRVFEGALSTYFQQTIVFGDTSLPVQERIFRYIDNIIDFFSEYPLMSTFIVKEISVNQELFGHKVKLLKQHTGPRLIEVLQQGMADGDIPELDPVIFLMNLHSMCAYPFLAAPIFKAIVMVNQLDWADPGNEKLKASVKDFVAFKLTGQQQ